MYTIGWLAVAVVVMCIGGLVAVLYAGFVRRPRHRPARYPGRGHDETVVLCAGDSLTAGTLSGDYVEMLRTRFDQRRCDRHRFINGGINGESAARLADRLPEILASEPDAVTVLIGTNNVRTDRADLHAYRRDLATVLAGLAGRRTAVLSIPPLGEDTHSEVNQRVARWNSATRELATGYGADYLPLFERIRAQLDRADRRDRPFKLRFRVLIGSALRRYVLRQGWNRIADAHRRAMLTDQIHLSDRGAEIAASLIAGWLTDAASHQPTPGTGELRCATPTQSAKHWNDWQHSATNAYANTPYAPIRASQPRYWPRNNASHPVDADRRVAEQLLPGMT